MRAKATLYGDRTSATVQAAEALAKSGVRFSVTLSHNAPVTPSLSTPVGEVRGLQNIREFAQHAAEATANNGEV